MVNLEYKYFFRPCIDILKICSFMQEYELVTKEATRLSQKDRDDNVKSMGSYFQISRSNVNIFT